MIDPEKALRETWTAEGVPVARQNEIIAEIHAKAAPGAMVGPFVLGGGDPAQKRYRVHVTITDHYYVDVKASDESDAMSEAQTLLSEMDEPLKAYEFHHSTGFDAQNAEEITNGE